MKRLLIVLLAALFGALAFGQTGNFLLGIVSISPAENNNARFIQGATEEAKLNGWTVQVIDGQGSADQANSAFQNLVTRRAGAIVDMVFPTTSLGAGLAATQRAGIPVGSWGGGPGQGVVAVNGTGGPMTVPVLEKMFADMGGKGSLLALTYHTGEVCRDREVVLDNMLKDYPDIKVTKNQVRIPGYFQDGAQYAAAWVASHPAGKESLAVWGCWDDPALGAISSLKQQGRNDVLVYGVNGNSDAIRAVRDGWLTATAFQQSSEEGKVMVQTLKQAAEAMSAGGTFEPQSIEVPAILVTKDNVDAFIQDHPDVVGQ